MPRVKVPIPAEKTEPKEEVKPTTPVPEQTLPPTPVGETYEPSSRQPRFTRQQWLIAGFGLVFIILLLVVINLLGDRNHLQSQVDKLADKPASGKQEAQQISNYIGEYIQLPSNEQPTLATVTDVNKLRAQSPVFFKNVANGDKVLIYAKAGEAIVYRPSTKKVIVIAPFNQTNANGATNSGASSSSVPLN